MHILLYLNNTMGSNWIDLKCSSLQGVLLLLACCMWLQAYYQ